MRMIIQSLRKAKLNVFDVIVLLSILSVITFFLYLRFSKQTEMVSVRLTVTSEDWWWEERAPQYWYVDGLERGMTARNTFGESVAEITNVTIFDNGSYKRKAFLDLDVRVTYDKNRQVYLYNYQPLQVGKPLELTFGKNNVRGVVTLVGGSEQLIDLYKERLIEVKLFQLRPFIADQYHKGMEMKAINGDVLAVIESVEMRPSETSEFSDIRGTYIPTQNPLYKDVTLKLRIKTFESGGVEYFIDRTAIKIGEEIWFQFPHDAIRKAIISDIEE